MQKQQGFKFEIRPDGQQRQIRRTAGACRYVYNRGLALIEETYKKTGKYISFEAMCKHLTAWKNERRPPG